MELLLQLLLTSFVGYFYILSDFGLDAAELLRIELSLLALLGGVLPYFLQTQSQQIAIFLGLVAFFLSSFFEVGVAVFCLTGILVGIQ